MSDTTQWWKHALEPRKAHADATKRVIIIKKENQVNAAGDALSAGVTGSWHERSLIQKAGFIQRHTWSLLASAVPGNTQPRCGRLPDITCGVNNKNLILCALIAAAGKNSRLFECVNFIHRRPVVNPYIRKQALRYIDFVNLMFQLRITQQQIHL